MVYFILDQRKGDVFMSHVSKLVPTTIGIVGVATMSLWVDSDLANLVFIMLSIAIAFRLILGVRSLFLKARIGQSDKPRLRG